MAPQTQPNLREQKGQELAQLKDNIKRINEKNYQVKSITRDEVYKILITSIGWVCSCADHMFRGVKCKHIYAVEFSLAIREKVKSDIIITPIDSLSCCYCSSNDVVKKAIRHNKHGDIQRYFCKECGKRFSFNIGFEKMHASPQMITSAIQLYFTGESFRNIKNFLKLQGVKVSHVTVYKWLGKYVSLMNKYLEKIKPNIGQAWRTDELYLKVKGNTKYLYALMDDETRFWIAQQVAETKNTADITPLFCKGKDVAGTRPNTLISDGAPNFHTAYNRELYTNKWPRTRHINHIRLQGDHNNNKMERMNGEIRDREKTMRGLKKVDTPILTGYQIYHNYMRPHEALDGETPAERCGIKVEGKNKWLTIIQNASKKDSIQ
jgi:transposase-like protein